jgi:hypothetical protein
MSQEGNCYGNTPVEIFFSDWKSEHIHFQISGPSKKLSLMYVPTSKAFIIGRGYIHHLVIGHQYSSSGTI